MALPILDFLVQRMQEYDPTFEHRVGTAFSDLFMQPLALIVQPLRDEANDIQLNQSLKRILELENPDLYPEDAVDELVGNFFVYRRQGSKSSGTVRLYYVDAIDLNYLAKGITFTSASEVTYTNINPVTISAQTMSNQIDGDFFYVDVTVEAESEGSDGDAEPGDIVTTTDPAAIRVNNLFSITGGADRETNTELIARTQESIGVRDLNTGKGVNAILFENFVDRLTKIQAIGFGDPEMMRDIVYNYHIGGRIDVFAKTPAVLDGEFEATGLTIDTTRRLNTLVNVILEGTQDTELGVQNLDNTENDVILYNIDEAERAATFYSYVDFTNGVDLSLNQFIGLSFEEGEYQSIKISGAIPSTTQIGEVVNRINVAVGEQVASIAVNPIVISRRRTAYVAAANLTQVYDPSPRIFKNVAPGDLFVVTVGTNKASYVIQTVANENTIILSTPLVNSEMEINYWISRTGKYLKLSSQVKDVTSKISIGSPLIGTDALSDALGLAPTVIPYEFVGTGRYAYQEAVDFSVDLVYGTVKRMIGALILPDTLTGQIDNSIYFDDFTANISLNVEAGDILTILDSADPDFEKDYRVLEKVNNNRLRLDSYFDGFETVVTYRVTRTGIKDGALVLSSFDYNPMSIDIGNKVQLDEYGRELGIRPGRESLTISDLALLWITRIELIDPVNGDPTGEVLDGKGGFGQGGYGRGGFGRGSRAAYFLKVNKPELRFSALEDSYIVINTAYLGQSFKVSYKFVPEILEFDSFARSDRERVLDADVLMRHFIPAVVEITMDIETDPTNPDTPTESELVSALSKYISETPGVKPLDSSDLVDVIYEQIDPARTRNAKIKTPISMKAVIHNTNGTRTVITSSDSLEIPEEDIPQYTPRPLSPRTAHWIAGDITLNVSVSNKAKGVF